MSRRRHYDDNIRDIRTMEDLRYHKMRLELSNDFLEEKLEDNLKGIKRRLSPRYLFRTIITSAVSLVGKRRAASDNDEKEDQRPDTTTVLLDGFIAIVKALFRAG